MQKRLASFLLVLFSLGLSSSSQGALDLNAGIDEIEMKLHAEQVEFGNTVSMMERISKNIEAFYLKEKISSPRQKLAFFSTIATITGLLDAGKLIVSGVSGGYCMFDIDEIPIVSRWNLAGLALQSMLKVSSFANAKPTVENAVYNSLELNFYNIAHTYVLGAYMRALSDELGSAKAREIAAQAAEFVMLRYFLENTDSIMRTAYDVAFKKLGSYRESNIFGTGGGWSAVEVYYFEKIPSEIAIYLNPWRKLLHPYLAQEKAVCFINGLCRDPGSSLYGLPYDIVFSILTTHLH